MVLHLKGTAESTALQKNRLAFASKIIAPDLCVSPRGFVWNFEGWVLLRISLGLAVRSFCNDFKIS